MVITILILLLSKVCFIEAGFFDWAFGTKEQEVPQVDHSMGSSLGKLVSVPFELRTADEKFIVEGSKYGLQTSDLDICHHKVIMQLKKSCGKLTEEDIGKLSVHLLNCQSSVEGRRTFQCTDEMSIGQCTKEMDPNMWNSYHIVSNRARAVCYAARQQQFSAKTEMTVNKLIYTSEQQISALKTLEEGQLKVGEMTVKTLDTMAVGQKELAERQEILKSSQHHIQTFVHGNLRELTREKALIAAGHKELAGMTEAIQKKLDEANKHMADNENVRKVNHKELIQDLAVVQEKAREMWEKINNSTQRILQQHSEAVQHYQITLENLERINTTVSYLLNLVDQARVEIDTKIGWVSALLFDAGDRLNVIYCCMVHSAYFLGSAVTASFLNAPFLARAAVLFIIPMNALSEVKQQSSLDFASLTALLVLTLAAHWMLKSVKAAWIFAPRLFHIYYGIHNSVINTVKPITWKAVSSYINKEKTFMTKCKKRRNSFGSLDCSTFSDDTVIGEDLSTSGRDITSKRPGTSTPTNLSPSFASEKLSETKDVIEDFEHSYGSINSLASSSSSKNLSRSQIHKRKCIGMNKGGTPCKGTATPSKDYCYRHLDQE